MSFDILGFIEFFCSGNVRRGRFEVEARKKITSILSENSIHFQEQIFNAKIPRTIKAELFGDNKPIPCLGASFQSGKFDNNSPIMNSFDANSEKNTIIFNPIAESLCLQTIKKQPAIAINRDSVVDLVMAQEISGEIIVESEEFESANIIIGNMQNPKNILFAHYDAIASAGAIDNGGSVAIILDMIISNTEFLRENCFVLAGCEEESISRPEGGYGFEIFDSKYSDLINNASKIIILDGIGVSEPMSSQNNLEWVFPISRINDVKHKCYWIMCDQSKIMKYYHSDLDTVDKIDIDLLNKAKTLIIDML